MDSHQPTVLLPVGLNWWRLNEQHWFRVSCSDEEHGFCVSSRYGIYFPDHKYASAEILEIEGRLLEYSECTGCYAYASWLSNASELRPHSIRVRADDAGAVEIATQFVVFGDVFPPVLTYASKSSAFLLLRGAREQNPKLYASWNDKVLPKRREGTEG